MYLCRRASWIVVGGTSMLPEASTAYWPAPLLEKLPMLLIAIDGVNTAISTQDSG